MPGGTRRWNFGLIKFSSPRGLKVSNKCWAATDTRYSASARTLSAADGLITTFHGTSIDPFPPSIKLMPQRRKGNFASSDLFAVRSKAESSPWRKPSQEWILSGCPKKCESLSIINLWFYNIPAGFGSKDSDGWAHKTQHVPAIFRFTLWAQL